MNSADFDGIQTFKWLILMLLSLLIIWNIVGPIYFYRNYIKFFIIIQTIYTVKFLYYLIMTTIATIKALNIIDMVDKKRPLIIHNRQPIFHAIVIPIYNEGKQLI